MAPPDPNAAQAVLASAALADEALVERVLDGDLASFETLMRRHNTRVYRTVRAVLRDEGEVEDAMQQAYLAAFSSLRQFRREASFSTWLLRIAHNEAGARRRRALHSVPLHDLDGDDDEAAMVDRKARPDEVAEARELTRFTEQAVDALPETLRSVFMLRGVQGLSAAEVAAVLAISEDVVKQRLHRAREAVRAHIAHHIDDQLGVTFDFQAPRCDRVVAAVLSAIDPGRIK
jgi:RNA polymerase sigma-70 factor (ECF subfamily)